MPASIGPYSILGILDSRRLSQLWGWGERPIPSDPLDPLVLAIPCDFRCFVAEAFADEAGTRLFFWWRDRWTCIDLARDVSWILRVAWSLVNILKLPDVAV